MSGRSLMVLAGALGAAAGANAQLSPWYITDGSSGLGNTYVMQYGVQQFQYQWSGTGQIPIYVTPSYVRQAEYSGTGATGETYSLGGTPQNIPNNFNNGGLNAYDAGFDGTNSYIVDWSNGQVARYDANYANRSNLFQANANDLGITVDGVGNIWTSNWGSGLISGYAPNGTFIAQFNGLGSNLSALAWDSLDNTLWVADAFSQIGRQFDMQGNPTGQQIQLPSYVLGGEMPRGVPAPGAAALMGLGGIVAMRRRR